MGLEPTRQPVARVKWDRRTQRPTRIVAGGGSLRVVGLTGRRDELAAFPAERGPRVTYLVDTDRGRAALVFDARRRAWFLEEVAKAA